MWSWCRPACMSSISARRRASTGRSRWRATRGLDPRRRLCRVEGRPANPIESGRARPLAENFHRRRSNKSSVRDAREVEAMSRSAARPWSMRGRRRSSPARRRRRPRKAYGHIPGAVNLDSATFYDASGQSPEAAGRACRARRVAVPAGPAVSLLQHRSLGGDRLVRAVGNSRPQGREALLRLDGRVDLGRRAARLPPRAPSGMTSRRSSASGRDRYRGQSLMRCHDARSDCSAACRGSTGRFSPPRCWRRPCSSRSSLARRAAGFGRAARCSASRSAWPSSRPSSRSPPRGGGSSSTARPADCSARCC